ncbi:FAD/NAD(P)-binding domain-containing protein [Cadophora sp. DSE1049]|nr:FAD/NAD(P)-binding domain-containing protein [Cadophora sp. DSE1049]
MPHQESQEAQTDPRNGSWGGDAPTTTENGRSSGYGDHHSYDSSRRPLHVVIAGAGPSGIAMAIELMNLSHITFEVFEKNPEVGGTWFENKYLGAACDVASHAYQYTFASNHDWSSHFAPAPEIFQYFKGVAERFKILEHIRLNTRIVSATFDEISSRWQLCVSNADDGMQTELQADIFINATGILNKWKWPDIAGLQNFKGPKLHTANWDTSWDWHGKRVAVIGSGATGIQVVPKLQPKVKSLEVYVRSPTYILPSVGFGVESSTFNEPYTKEEKERFHNDKKYYREFRKAIEQQMNENFAASIQNSAAQIEGRQWAENMMRKSIKSEELQKKLIPKWELGCRRLTPGKPYLDVVQRENVEIVTSHIDKIVEGGIKTVDGRTHHLDAIVCATGFDTSFTPAFELHGLKNQNLRMMWSQSPAEAYMGLAVSGFPNYWTFLGPNTPIANGSLIPCIEWSAKYIVQALKKMQAEQIKSMNIKKNIQDAFNEYTQAVHKDLVWTGSCRSWYKDNASNKVTAVWPGSSIHFMDVVKTPRWEDYEIEYMNQNPFMFMGNGISAREHNKEDLTYYLNGI